MPPHRVRSWRVPRSGSTASSRASWARCSSAATTCCTFEGCPRRTTHDSSGAGVDVLLMATRVRPFRSRIRGGECRTRVRPSPPHSSVLSLVAVGARMCARVPQMSSLVSNSKYPPTCAPPLSGQCAYRIYVCRNWCSNRSVRNTGNQDGSADAENRKNDICTFLKRM